MALLLVMIGMIVCTILTAGFLATQGTAIGIARNERDATKCRAIAQTGIDMCYWLIRNRNDWRQSMTPGQWLSNVAIGDGTVSAKVVDANGNPAFTTDPTQGVAITSTGTYDSRSFSLSATVRPTGGGTVYVAGNFIQGNIQLGQSLLDLSGGKIDSYNSSNGTYAQTVAGNGAFGSNASGLGALTMYFPSIFNGSYTAAPNVPLLNILSILGGGSGPTSSSNAGQTRNPGTVLMPNTTGLVYRGAFSPTSIANLSQPGRYDSFTTNTFGVTISASGLYYITGNFNVGGTGASVTVSPNVAAVIMVEGAITIAKPVTLGNGSQLAFYCDGTVLNPSTVTVTNTSVNSTGATSQFTVFGSQNCKTITVTGALGKVVGSIYAPQADLTMKTSGPVLYGAVVANNLYLYNGAALHFDEALRTGLSMSNITGGSAPTESAPTAVTGGNSFYQISITGGPGIGH